MVTLMVRFSILLLDIFIPHNVVFMFSLLTLWLFLLNLCINKYRGMDYPVAHTTASHEVINSLHFINKTYALVFSDAFKSYLNPNYGK
jgi:hypothetical protein